MSIETHNPTSENMAPPTGEPTPISEKPANTPGGKGWWDDWGSRAVIIITIVAAVVGFPVWVKTTAQNAVLDETFVGKLSQRLRPYAIINRQGSVVSSSGMDGLLKGVACETASGGGEMRITLSFDRHLGNPPLVRCTSGPIPLYFDRAERGKMHDWNVWMRVTLQTATDAELGREDTGMPFTTVLKAIAPDSPFEFLVEVLP